jgi:glucose-6-phosphate 1-dehydrogenase
VDAAILPNPLRIGSHLERTPPPAVLVLFGASGDLTQRKLVPALYTLVSGGALPSGLVVIGVARRPLSEDAFRDAMRAAIDEHARIRPVDTPTWEALAPRLHYHTADFADRAGYDALSRRIAELDARFDLQDNRLYYLATPPDSFPVIAENLGHAGMAHDDAARGFRRIVVEKPFGHDHASAVALDATLAKWFREDEIFRIDHYLGKETVQNILMMRFANTILEPLWNQKYVDHVQISVAEEIGIENRAGYFEKAGILRDIVQNHALQLLALTAMEAPVAWEADAVRDEKAKALRALRRLTPDEAARQVVRGQYGPGWMHGRRVPGYREEPGVDPGSTIETYVALELRVENWRWAGVPFYLRAGKRLAKRVTEIAVQFKPVPYLLFGRDRVPQPNALVLRIQPDEGVSLRFDVKSPGPDLDLRSVSMDFRYGASFGREPPEAYERLLLDALLGDASLFTRHDTLVRSWQIVDSITAAWREAPAPAFPNYEAGSWGPGEADELLARSGRSWRRP